MRKSLKILLAASLFATTPAWAGSLTFDAGQATWHSTQCPKPTPPPSILGANPETSGEDMSALITQHNAYVDAAQIYMNCISAEAEHDQIAVNQEITSDAQKAIADTQADIEKDAKPLRGR